MRQDDGVTTVRPSGSKLDSMAVRIAVIAMAASACVSPASRDVNQPLGEVTRIERSDLVGAVWLTDERLALLSVEQDNVTHVEQANSDGQAVGSPFALPRDASCAVDMYTSIARI